MRLLLDTHVLLWWLSDTAMTPEATEAIASADSEVHVSVATVWEMSIKAGLGRLTAPDDLAHQLQRQAFEVLPVRLDHALAVRELPPHHADPFDRMLVAQAQREDLVLVSRDRHLPRYAVRVLPA